MKKKFLLSHQTAFMRAPYLYPEIRFFIFTAGYGAGKTSSVATSVTYDIMMLKDKKDQEGRRPRLGLGGKSLGHLVKTTLGYIISDLENSKTPYKYNSKESVLSVGNVDLYLVSLSRPGDIVGYDVCGFYGDEVDDLGSVAISSASDMTFEAVKAVNERTRQVIPGFRAPFVKFASTSQGQRGLYRVVSQFNKEQTAYLRIKARTRDNFYLKKEYVDSLYKFYTETEAKVYLEGEFLSVGSGRIFPDFDWDQNFSRIAMDRTVLPNEELYWAQDFNMGYFRGCIGVLRGNALYVIKRYEFEQIMDAPRVVRYDFPHNKIIWIPDASSNNQILTFASELRKYNIFWALRSKNPNIEDTVFLVNKLLYMRRLVFTEMAKETAEACSLALRDPKTGMIPKGIGKRSPIHDIDSLRMLCYFLIFKPVMKDIRDLTIRRRLEQWKDDEEVFGDKEAARNIIKTGGYSIIGPELL
jgi:Holliday junction resolvase